MCLPGAVRYCGLSSCGGTVQDFSVKLAAACLDLIGLYLNSHRASHGLCPCSCSWLSSHPLDTHVLRRTSRLAAYTPPLWVWRACACLRVSRGFVPQHPACVSIFHSGKTQLASPSMLVLSAVHALLASPSILVLSAVRAGLRPVCVRDVVTTDVARAAAWIQVLTPPPQKKKPEVLQVTGPPANKQTKTKNTLLPLPAALPPLRQHIDFFAQRTPAARHRLPRLCRSSSRHSTRHRGGGQTEVGAHGEAVTDFPLQTSQHVLSPAQTVFTTRLASFLPARHPFASPFTDPVTPTASIRPSQALPRAPCSMNRALAGQWTSGTARQALAPARPAQQQQRRRVRTPMPRPWAQQARAPRPQPLPRPQSTRSRVLQHLARLQNHRQCPPQQGPETTPRLPPRPAAASQHPNRMPKPCLARRQQRQQMPASSTALARVLAQPQQGSRSRQPWRPWLP